MTTAYLDSNDLLGLLSRLMLSDVVEDQLPVLSPREFQEMLSLANSHHVVMRSMGILRGILAGGEDGSGGYKRATEAVDRERLRIQNAVPFLRHICETLASEGCEVIVIKSLDHWPDLGSDLDLYTSAEPAKVIRVMQELDARPAARSWGDRLANKWNFMLPGLPELVEIHMGRLGQTGELMGFAGSLVARSRSLQIGNHLFRVPAPTDRLMICTLQRMYRHFYARLCDIVDTAELLETEVIDYDDLRSSAQENGIWEGVATFLVIVSDYVHNYRGRGIVLPSSVRSAARFGGDKVRFGKGFLRVPILPHSARLYASEWTALMLHGKLRSTARLSLLPCLATAAALGQKITGSDKGIW